MAKLLILLGILLIIGGVLMHYKLFFFGKLPGDFVIKGENYAIYFPLTTSILLSVLLSLLFYWIFGSRGS